MTPCNHIMPPDFNRQERDAMTALPTPAEMAERARDTLDHYWRRHESTYLEQPDLEDLEYAASDLLADILHMFDEYGFDTPGLFERAHMHHGEEETR